MKQLSIEEKAKAYDEAFEVAQRFYNNSVAITKKGLEDMFPELKQSEDELTWLKRFIKEEIDCLSFDIRDSEDRVKLKNLQRSISWLEKQGEKTIEEVARKVKHDKEYAIAFLKSAGILNEDGQLAEEYRTEADTDKSEQNPAWSEEDETMLKRVIDFIPQHMTAHGYNEYINWFKDLKDRVQPKQDWSEEDENNYDR